VTPNSGYGPTGDPRLFQGKVTGTLRKCMRKEESTISIIYNISDTHLSLDLKTLYLTAHGSDKEGPKAGVPYDGTNLDNQDLYHAKATPDDKDWLTRNPAFQLEWYRSIKELVDNYQPDLLYSDSWIPFEDVGRTLISHYYNRDIAKNNGKLEAIYTCKQPSAGMWVEDLERGVKDTISQYPWQTGKKSSADLMRISVLAPGTYVLQQ